MVNFIGVGYQMPRLC